jgi:hypothetical protein
MLTSSRDLPEGSPVERFAGAIVAWAEVAAADEPRAVAIGPGRRMIVETAARAIVASTDPSCAVDPELVVVTSRVVREGEPLTIAYDALAQAFSLREAPGPLAAPAVNVSAAGPKGRGVFAARCFAPGELIERAPVIVVPPAEVDAVERGPLGDYVYAWGRRKELDAVVLGYGSLYNHSFRPSAIYLRRPAEPALDFVALRAIAEGEEITVNYNGDPSDAAPVWFEVVET